MNYFIYWNENDEICIGELGILIPDEYKNWTLHPDKTISPSNKEDYVIGVSKSEEGH